MHVSTHSYFHIQWKDTFQVTSIKPEHTHNFRNNECGNPNRNMHNRMHIVRGWSNQKILTHRYLMHFSEKRF